MSDPTYCWSSDEEEYHGDCPSREAAIAEAEDNIAGDYEPGDTASVWTGEVRHAMHFLRRSEYEIARRLVEELDESLFDEIASEDSIIHLAKDKHAELGKLILDYLEEHASFNRYGVEKIQTHTITISPEDA